ncbi:MAG: dihydropteroate synthase [bacterium]
MNWLYKGAPLLRADGRCSVMGILNVTPDSFSDGGQAFLPDLAVARASEMLVQGADILDLGGESTRPGAEPVPADEEWRRVGPVLEQLREQVPQALLSIDTFKPEVARQATALGVQIVNDITGLDPAGQMGEVVAESGASLVIMHMQGTPATMQNNPQYDDVVGVVLAFFEQRLRFAERLGIGPERIALDPGIGFGKRLEHNISLLQSMDRFRQLGSVVLIGTSRKRMIGELTGRVVSERMAGSVASAIYAAWQGASIVRVHDVAETADGLNVWSALTGKN